MRLPAALLGLLGLLGAGVAAVAAALLAGRTRAQRSTRRVAPPFTPQWTPGPPRYGVGVRHNVAVPMSDGVVLRAEVHYPTDPVSGAAAPGPFPVLVCVTPYGKKAPPPAAQLGGGASPYLITRGYIEVLVDVRGTGASDGAFEMFGARQTRDGVELVDWAATLPHASGRVGLFGLSYLGINQLFTAAAVGPGSPLRAIFPVMAATDFYRDAATMGGVPHLWAIRGYAAAYRLLNVINPTLEALTGGGHPRPRSGGWAAVRRRGRTQRGYFGPLAADVRGGGDTAFDGPFWDSMRPSEVLGDIAANGVAVLLTGGWHDAFQRAAPLNYAGLQNAAAGRDVHAPMQPGQPIAERIKLVMGPWYHVSDYGGMHLDALQLRWFDHWLKDDADAALPDAPLTFRPIGSPHWLRAREYPLPEAVPTRLYLSESGRLAETADVETSAATMVFRSRGPVSGRSLEQWSLGLGSFAVGRSGGRIRYDRDNRRLQRGALTYTTAAVPAPVLVAGPITLTLYARATTTESLWVAHLDDVAPDGVSRPLTQGALLGSHRALDPRRSWYLPDGTVLRPHHLSTRAACTPVEPGELTRYDLEIFPTAAWLRAGHRLRLTVTSFDFPQLVPARPAQRALAGGRYELQQGGAEASYLLVPLVDADTLR